VTDGVRIGYRKALDEIREFNPDVLGVSFTTPAAGGAYQLVNEVKACLPETVVVCGGPHATAMPEDVLTRSKADYVIRGEGEATFYRLISSDEPESVGGIAFRDGERVVETPPEPLIESLDDIPFPARDLLDMKKYPGYYVTKKRPDTDIISTRGCPFNCTFCSNPVWKLQKPWWRMRSPQNVVDEVEMLVKDYGIKEYFDQCDEFNASKKWALDVCEELIARNLEVIWKVQVRVDTLDEELVAKMAEAGCWLVFIGIESGNEETLKGIRKHVTLNQVREACRLFRKHGIKVFGLFMAFNVWEEEGRLVYEDAEKTRETLRFAEALIKEGLLQYLTWSLATPYPFSELYDVAIRHGLIPEDLVGKWDEIEPIWNFTMKLPTVSEEDWKSVKSRGARLQARCIIKNRQFNASNMRLMTERGVNMMRLELERFARRLSGTRGS
jgi:radical SAM superfamily enzyme YgiQ (UPF0313 family)